jgi:hypothetical protein
MRAVAVLTRISIEQAVRPLFKPFTAMAVFDAKANRKDFQIVNYSD